MPWTKPDFVEISLNMEVTGYVNTDETDIGPNSAGAASKETAWQERPVSEART